MSFFDCENILSSAPSVISDGLSLSEGSGEAAGLSFCFLCTKNLMAFMNFCSFTMLPTSDLNLQ